MLTQFISRPSRLAISLPSSMRIPWRLPFSSMYWTGGKVALVATTSLPGRTTAGGVTTGAVGYLAAWAPASAGAASRARAIRDDGRRLPRLCIALPPLVTRGVDDAESSRLVDDSADRPEGSPYLPRIGRSARRSAAAEGGEAGFEGDGFFVGEGRGAEAAPLVGGGEPGHGGGHRGRRRLHAERELARRLGGTATIAATGEGAQGPHIEPRHRSRSDAVGGPGRAAPQQPARDGEGGHRNGHRAPRKLARRRQPPAGPTTPLARPAVHGSRHADLVLETPVDDVAVPAHAHGIDVEVPDRGPGEGLVEGGARRGIEGDPARALEVGLDPGVRVLHAHHEVAAVGIPLPTLEARHHAGGHADAPEHHGEGGREVLAVAGTAHEEKLLEGVEQCLLLEHEGVREALGGEVLGEAEGRVVGTAAALRHLAREVADARRHGWELEEAAEAPRRRLHRPPARPEAAGRRELELGVRGVLQARRHRGEDDAAHVVHGHRGRPQLEAEDAGGHEHRVGPDGIEEDLLAHDGPVAVWSA